jgi:hypothetical protein
MPAAVADYTIEQGATWEQDVWWEDSDGNPIDLTGYTARMQARAALPDVGTLVDLTTANGGIVLTPAEGKLTLIMTAAQTAALNWPSGRHAPGSGVYQLELESPTGFVTRLLKGTLTLDPEVTHPVEP